MKTKLIFSAVTSFYMLFMSSSCGKQENEKFEDCFTPSTGFSPIVGDPQLAIDCNVFTFLEGISRYSRCSDVYLVKGIVLDAYEYGLNIKLVEDLKGNFQKNVSTFKTWGANTSSSVYLYRSDNLSIYDKKDILMMHLISAPDFPFLDPESFPEKSGDYTTLPCTFSVLKLSDGYVNGFILPNVSTMSWKDFQKKLKKILKK